MLETPSAPPQPSQSTSDPLHLPIDQDSSPQDQTIPQPAATSSPQKEAINPDLESAATDKDSGPMLFLSESLQESFTEDDPGRSAGESKEEQTHSVANSAEKQPVAQPPEAPLSADPAVMQQPAKIKKDKLAMLKKLGMNPPPVAKLCPDDGAFVHLEPPQIKPGEDQPGSRNANYQFNHSVNQHFSQESNFHNKNVYKSRYLIKINSFNLIISQILNQKLINYHLIDRKLKCSTITAAYLYSLLNEPGLVALRERYLRHVKAPKPEQGERTMQLNIVCKNKTPSGREELCTESLTVTVKEKAKELPTTKPGVHRAAIFA